MRMSVVLPAPLGPTRPTRSPANSSNADVLEQRPLVERPRQSGATQQQHAFGPRSVGRGALPLAMVSRPVRADGRPQRRLPKPRRGAIPQRGTMPLVRCEGHVIRRGIEDFAPPAGPRLEGRPVARVPRPQDAAVRIQEERHVRRATGSHPRPTRWSRAKDSAERGRRRPRGPSRARPAAGRARRSGPKPAATRSGRAAQSGGTEPLFPTSPRAGIRCAMSEGGIGTASTRVPSRVGMTTAREIRNGDSARSESRVPITSSRPAASTPRRRTPPSTTLPGQRGDGGVVTSMTAQSGSFGTCRALFR